VGPAGTVALVVPAAVDAAGVALPELDRRRDQHEAAVARRAGQRPALGRRLFGQVLSPGPQLVLVLEWGAWSQTLATAWPARLRVAHS
jgi:hypothetical protein